MGNEFVFLVSGFTANAVEQNPKVALDHSQNYTKSDAVNKSDALFQRIFDGKSSVNMSSPSNIAPIDLTVSDNGKNYHLLLPSHHISNMGNFSFGRQCYIDKIHPSGTTEHFGHS